jgi:hypothetical protein
MIQIINILILIVLMISCIRYGIHIITKDLFSKHRINSSELEKYNSIKYLIQYFKDGF